MSSIHVARQGFVTKSALPSVSRERGTTTVADNRTVLLLNGNGTNGAQNNTFVDSSTNNFSITRNGNATQGSFSPFTLPDGQWSNFFDGTGDALTFTNTDYTGDFTFECWVYPLSTADQIIAGSNGNFSGSNTQIFRLNETTAGNLSYYGGANAVVLSAGITPNQWYHLAMSRTSGTLQTFVNGTRIDSRTYTNTFKLGAVGALVNPTVSTSVNGYISNFRAINGTGIYSGTTITVPTTPLTAITNTSLLTCQSNRFRDNSSNNFAITRNGDVRVTPWSPFAPTSAYDPATNGGSGYFDGTGDYLEVADNNTLDLSNDFTIECWVYPQKRSGATVPRILSKGDYQVSTGSWTLIYNESTFLSYFSYGIPEIGVTIGTLVPSQWQHIAVTRDGTTLRTFLNGVLTSTSTVSTDFTSTHPFRVGVGSTTQSGEMFTGNVSNVRVVKGTAVYTSAFTPPTAPVTNITNTSLLLNFTNAGIFDTAGDNVIETVGNAQIDTAIKKYGSGSLEFDGTGDYLTVPANQLIDLSTGDFTFEFWAYPTTRTNSVDSVFGYGSFTMMLYHNSSNNWVLEIGNGSSNYFTISTSRDLNVWTHLAITRSGNTFTLWKNGVSAGTATNSGAVALSARSLFIGVNSNGGNQIFTGYIDDFRITRGFARYTSTFTPPTAELAIFGTVPNIVNNSTYGVYQLA